ncbi:hypothetical protein C8Q78DRAFT_990634 [Trametes maxima]|nr:hypothetical protein C8Q78DRAFT_990634 [Trametes maxima]
MSDTTSSPVLISMPLPDSEYPQPTMLSIIPPANSDPDDSDASSTDPSGQETGESSATGSDSDTSGTDAIDSAKEATSVTSHGEAPVIKHVDRYLNLKDGTWEYKDTASSLPAEAYVASSGSDTPPGLEDCCFGVVRRLPHPRDSEGTISFHFLMKCKELLKVFDDVMGDISGTSWNEDPVKVKPELLLTFFPKLVDFHETLSSRSRTDGEEHAMQVLGLLLEYIRANYGQTLSKIVHLTSYGEISFDLLYSILIPQTLVVKRCSWTREQRVWVTPWRSTTTSSLFPTLCAHYERPQGVRHTRSGV